MSFRQNFLIPKKVRIQPSWFIKKLDKVKDTELPNPIHDIMNNAIQEWLTQESKKILKDSHVIITYQNILDDYKADLKKQPYYYLEWQPDVNFEEWYLHMIKTANAHGHTVYSDVDFSFYLPDSTSVPENSRKRLEAVVRHQQEQIFDGGYEAVVNILQEEANNPPDATKISKYLSTVHSRVMIFSAILQQCFDKYGIKVTISSEKGEDFGAICHWQDEVKFVLNYQIYYSSVFYISKLSCRIDLNDDNPRIAEELNTKGVYNRGGMTLSWNNRTHFLISYYEKHQGSSLDNKTLRIEANEVLDVQNITNTVTALHHKLTQDIDDFVQTMYQYGNLYDFIDASYQETHPLHSYLWSSQNIVHVADGVLMLAEYVKHPKLQRNGQKTSITRGESQCQCP